MPYIRGNYMFLNLLPMGCVIIFGLAVILVNGIEADNAKIRNDRMKREIEQYNTKKAYEKMQLERNGEVENVSSKDLGA